MANIGKIEDIHITEEMQRSYLDYAMSVIVSRALPDVRDGLKPVHRRILYAMHKMGLTYNNRFNKSAKVVGEVLGKYHPHGDIPVYDALVRMAQDFSMRYPLIHGQGNFGSVDGDPPAAMRYTEVKLSKIASQLLSDIEKETVPYTDNFDGSLKEPLLLPAAMPNLLLMGADGIAVGMATKIPPHNLSEVVDALLFIIDKKIKPQTVTEVTLDEIMQFIKGPDFPTAGIIYDKDEIVNTYATGRGKILMRAKTTIDELPNGKTAIIVTEIPYQVNKAQTIAKIAQLVKDKKIVGITDLRDESDRRGIRIVIELKRGSIPNKILNRLFKYTQLQTTFPANMVALVEGTPQTLTLKEILEFFIAHREEIITKRSEFELRQAKAREHILEGLVIAVDNIDEVIHTIRNSKDVEDAKLQLIDKFTLTEIQAIAILDMQLKKLAALERQKLIDELAEVRKIIAYLEDLLSHKDKLYGLMKQELSELKTTFGDERKTKIIKGALKEFRDEDLIPNIETLVTISKTGYIKRMTAVTFKLQRRGGKGVIGMTTKEEDNIEHLLTVNTHDYLLFFTNKGRVFRVRGWDIPEGVRQSKGQALVNFLNIEDGELVQSVLNIPSEELSDTSTASCFMATKFGVVKRTKLINFKNIKTSGIIAIKLDENDELVWVHKTSGKDDIMLVTHSGKVIRFHESEVRETGRATRGVTGIHLKKDDYVVAVSCIFSEPKINPESKKKPFTDLLVIMQHGIGKRTDVSEFRGQHRGGKGIKVANITPKTGPVHIALLITQLDTEIVISSLHGQVIKLPIKNIPRLSRNTQGVILMRFSSKDDAPTAATLV
jgi:DNA gyrase subunit A